MVGALWKFSTTVGLGGCFINMDVGKKISLLTLESGMLVETVSEVND